MREVEEEAAQPVLETPNIHRRKYSLVNSTNNRRSNFLAELIPAFGYKDS